MQFSRGVDIFYTMHYELFSRGKYYLYYELRSSSGGSILFILSTTELFWGMDTSYTTHYALFSGVNIFCTMNYAILSGGRYCLYYALRSIFGG